MLCLLALGLAGCRDDGEGSSSGSQDKEAEEFRPSSDADNASLFTDPLFSIQQPGDGQIPDDESSARWGRMSFDGDRRALGGLFADKPQVRAGFSSSRRLAGNWLASQAGKTAAGNIDAAQVPSPELAAFMKNERGGSRLNAVLSTFERFQQSVYSFAYPVLSRLDWSARTAKSSKKDSTPYRITLHHTTGGQPTDRDESIKVLRSIQAFHQRRRGWSDIGYHFVIDGAGRIFEGRAIETVGTHTKNQNDGNIGIALMGNFQTQHPSQEQLESLERLCAFLSARYDIDPKSRLNVHQHFKETLCPGRHMLDIFEQLRTDVLARVGTIRTKASGSDFQPLLSLQKA
ncbi:MAG: peptidoglycan recognition protein [Elusimicrobiota bacterium]